jgi:hypothetical protein
MKEMTASLPLLINQRLVRILMSMEIVVAEISEISIVKCEQFLFTMLLRTFSVASICKPRKQHKTTCQGQSRPLPWP